MKKMLLGLCIIMPQLLSAFELDRQITFAHKSVSLTDGIKAQIEGLCAQQEVNELYIFRFLSDEETVLSVRVQDSISYIRASKTAEYIREKGLIHGKVLIQHQKYIVMPDRMVLSKQVRDGKVAEKGVYRLSVFKEPGFNEPTHLSAQPWEDIDCQSARIYISEYNLVAFRQGTVIEIPASALVLENGKKPKSTVADICVSEFYEKDDMVAADLCTMSDHKMLVSGGMIHVRITCTEGRLILAKNQQIRIYMPSEKTHADMQTFHGEKQAGILNWNLSRRDNVETTNLSPEDFFAQSVPEKEIMDSEPVGEYNPELGWRERDEDLDKLERAVDGIFTGPEGPGGHVLSSSKLEWINCDRFYDMENKTDLLVVVDTTINVAVRMIFQDFKSVMPGYVYKEKKSATFNGIPVGERATVLVYAVSEDEDKAMVGMKDLLIGDKAVIDLSQLEEVSLDKLAQKIAGKF